MTRGAAGAGPAGAAGGTGRPGLVLLVVLVLALAGCSPAVSEPGLFGRRDGPTSIGPRPGPSPQVPTTRSEDTRHVRTSETNPDLPVVGEAVWTSPGPAEVPLRIAVHAVRLLPGATVLDWSLTPLAGRGLSTGDLVPGVVDLGLTRAAQDSLNVLLIDAFGAKVFRPLTTRDYAGLQNCLCSPVRLAERRLRVGQTQLMQIAYPALPRALTTVDVDFPTVPMFWHVPVTPQAMVPLATNPVDLTRAAEPETLGRTSKRFRYGPGRQEFVVTVDEVIGSSTFTSMRWTVQSLTNGTGLDTATEEPLSAGPGVGESANATSASGPGIRPAGGSTGVSRHMSSGSPSASVECLCSDLRSWASTLRAAQQEASVVTNFAALPLGTQDVDVVLPGLPPIRDVAVTSASDATVRSAGPVPQRTGTWTFDADNPPAGWSSDEWPTPLPDPAQLSHFDASVVELLR